MYQASPDLDARPGAAGRGVAFARRLATVSVLAWSLVGAGVVLRVVRFADNRALWLDEAMLALNLVERGFRALLQPLDYNQAAPPLFLLLEKVSVVALGGTEYSLRLVPLVAALAALILFRQLTARVLPGLAGLVALGLFALAEPLVYWAGEAKQYSLDVLAAVALLYVASEPLLTGRLTRRRAVALASLGAVAVFFSYASVFVLAGIAVALAVDPLLARRRPSAASLAVLGIWLLSLAGVGVLVAATTAEIRASLALEQWNAQTPLELGRDVWRAIADPGPFARTTIALPVLTAALGAAALWRRYPRLVVALGMTFLATCAAALADLYPFLGRFVLFLVPLLLLLVGAGIAALRDVTAGRTGAVWVAVLVLLAVYPAGLAVRNAVQPPKVEETRDVLRPLEERWRPGDRLFVARLAKPALAYYAECEACGVLDGKPTDDLRRLVLSARSSASERGLRAGGRLAAGDVDHPVPYAEVAAHFERLRGEPRLWVLLASGWNHAFVSHTLDCLGRKLEGYEATDAAAYLYDLSGRPARSDGCLTG